MAQPPLSGLSEAERARAFERFELLRPALEEGVPLARVARDRGLALRTAARWAGQYRREGLAGLARKGRSDRGKRRLSDTLRQAIEGLALKKPPLSAASIHRQAVTLAERLGEPPPSYGTVYRRDPRPGPGPGDPGPRGDEGLCRRLRPGPPPRGDRPQRRLAGRSYGTRHPC